MTKGITKNQITSPVKIQRSRELRKQMTEAEKIFWKRVRNRKLDTLKFRRQQIIDGFIVDFYCEELSLVVELDGCIHDDPNQRLRDDSRDEFFRQRGLHVLRVRNHDVINRFNDVIEKIRETSSPPTRSLNVHPRLRDPATSCCTLLPSEKGECKKGQNPINEPSLLGRGRAERGEVRAPKITCGIEYRYDKETEERRETDG